MNSKSDFHLLQTMRVFALCLDGDMIWTSIMMPPASVVGPKSIQLRNRLDLLFQSKPL